MTNLFEYLLNAMEAAAQSSNPAMEEYGIKRRKVLEYVAELEKRVQPEAARWVPVAEKLPDDDITVMIAGKMDEPVWLGFHDESGWYSVDAMPLRDMVTHWRNLPEPPHG